MRGPRGSPFRVLTPTFVFGEFRGFQRISKAFIGNMVAQLAETHIRKKILKYGILTSSKGAQKCQDPFSDGFATEWLKRN